MQAVSAVANGIAIIPSIVPSKPLMLTILAITILSNIPKAEASVSLYAKCFKTCMNGAGNVAIVAMPICAAACTVALPF